MESTRISTRISLIGYSLKWLCCSLVWPESLLSKTGFDPLGRDQSSFRLSALSVLPSAHKVRIYKEYHKCMSLRRNWASPSDINIYKTWICTGRFLYVWLYADLKLTTDNKIILYSQLLHCILIVIALFFTRQYWCAKNVIYSICTLLNPESFNLTFCSYIERKAHCEERQREDEGTAAIYIYLMRVNLAWVHGWRQQMYPLPELKQKEKRNHGLYQNIHYPR